MREIFEIFVILAIFGVILLLTYYSTKFIASKAGHMYKGKYIKVVETLNIGSDKKIALIKVEGKFFLIAVTSKNIEMLTELNIENYVDEPSKDRRFFDSQMNFKKILDKITLKQNKSIEDNIKKGSDLKEKSNIYIRDLRKNIDKIKDINVHIKENNGTKGSGDNEEDKV